MDLRRYALCPETCHNTAITYTLCLSFSPKDLQSILTEVNGDVDLAATRISEGNAPSIPFLFFLLL